MRYFFPYRRTAGGTLKIEMQDSKPGDFEILSDKYFASLGKVREEIETDLGSLRLADMDFTIVDHDRKFRDDIFATDGRKFLKLLYEERQHTFISPRALDLDGSTEYLSSDSPDFDMNGPEEVTNTGFETDTAGWTLDDKSSRKNVRIHSGSWSLEDQGSSTEGFNEYVFPSNRMHQITTEAWIWIESYTDGEIKIELLDSADNSLATVNANTGTTGAWQKLVINLDSILVRKIRLHNTGNAVVYWDDVSLTRAWDFTIAAWVKTSKNDSDYQTIISKYVGGLGNNFEAYVQANAFQWFVRDGDGNDVNVSSGTPVANGAFHLFVGTGDRDSLSQLFKDGVFASSASMVQVGAMRPGATLKVGSRNGSLNFTGLLGEAMVIKGWAADTITVADWFANGIRMRSDTIGFWRWQHPTDFARDYSGKFHDLLPVNVDANDIVRDEPRGSFEPYKQRAQKNETLFYGVAKMATSGHDEKRNIVKLMGYSPVKDLENVPIADLWNFIQLGGWNEEKRIFAGDYSPGHEVRAVSLGNIIGAMGALVGFGSSLAEIGWRFGVESGPGAYPFDFGFEKLYVVVDDLDTYGYVHSGVFDSDFERSKLSWMNLYANCLELLKALQLALFSFATGRYRNDLGYGLLNMRQRGLVGESPVVPVGTLLEYGKETMENDGIVVKNLYHQQFVLPPAEMQTQYGTGEVEIALPFKIFERTIADYPYTYLYASWQPSTNDELITNGDFETNTAGWTLNGASSRDNTRALPGTWSLKDAGASGTYNEWIIPVDLPNDLVEVTGNLWSSAFSTTAVRVELIGLNGQILRTYSTRVNAQWQDLQDLLAVGVKKIRLYGNTAANPVWWDGLSARAVVPAHLVNGIFMVNKIVPHGWPLNGVPYPNLHSALANAYGLSSVGKKDLHVRSFHRPLVTKDGTISMDSARVLEREDFLYRDELMNLDVVRTEFDVEKNTMTRWGTKR